MSSNDGECVDDKKCCVKCMYTRDLVVSAKSDDSRACSVRFGDGNRTRSQFTCTANLGAPTVSHQIKSLRLSDNYAHERVPVFVMRCHNVVEDVYKVE